MQKIQLYIQDQRVELFSDEGVVVTDTIKNAKEPAKLFTEFSKTFSLPASKTNNKIFKHFYNGAIVNGFDARVRTAARIELNSLPYKYGFIKLEGVDLLEGVAHTYKITFFGNTVSLKNTLGDDSLSDLDWLNNFNTNQAGNNIIYNPSFIESYLTIQLNKTVNGINYLKPIQVPLITHTQRLFYNSAEDIDDNGNLHYTAGGDKGVRWDNLKYAIRLPLIIKAIEEKYSITFSTDFFNESNTAWSDLFLWLHRVKGVPTNGGQISSSTSPVIGWADESDEAVSGASISSNTLFIEDSLNKNATIVFTPEGADAGVLYDFTIFKNGTGIITSGDVSGTQTATVPTSGNFFDSYRVEMTSSAEVVFTSVIWSVQYSTGSKNFTNTNFTKKDEFALVIRQQIPKMKVIDFLTAVFKAFNLVAYVENSIIVVKTLDAFYASGTSFDIGKFLDVSKSQSNVALPYSEVKYTYNGLGTILALAHEQIENQVWGELEYTGDSPLNFSGGTYNYSIQFEHMKFERLRNVNSPTPPTDIQWGFCVDDNQDPYIGEPLIFYMARKTADISFVDNINAAGTFVNHKKITNYFAPCNSNMNIELKANQPSIDFSTGPDEWEGVDNDNSLFEVYHKNFMSSIFNKSNRITKVTAYLPLRILLTYKLNDIFEISGNSYKINSITTNLENGKSELELLNDL